MSRSIALFALFSLAVTSPAFAQDEAATVDTPAAEEATATEPVKCPIGGGGYQELYAVAILLTNQDKLAEAEVCLSDAITSTMPAFRLLADIATSKGEAGRSWKIAELMDTVMNNGEPLLIICGLLSAAALYPSPCPPCSPFRPAQPPSTGISTAVCSAAGNSKLYLVRKLLQLADGAECAPPPPALPSAAYFDQPRLSWP